MELREGPESRPHNLPNDLPEGAEDHEYRDFDGEQDFPEDDDNIGNRADPEERGGRHEPDDEDDNRGNRIEDDDELDDQDDFDDEDREGHPDNDEDADDQGGGEELAHPDDHLLDEELGLPEGGPREGEGGQDRTGRRNRRDRGRRNRRDRHRNRREREDRPGTLAVRIGDRFGPKIRDRGERYFRGGLIGSPTYSPQCVELPVRGSEKYSVRVDWSRVETNNEILLECSCPYYAGGSHCKHCWAVILYLDSENISAEIPGKNRLRLLHTGKRIDNSERGGRRERGRNRRERGRNREHDPRGQSRPEPRPTEPPTPSHPRTAFFILDLVTSRSKGEAVIQFHHQNLLPDGRQSPVQPGAVSRGDLALYASPQDREVLGMLLAGTGVMTSYAQAHLAQSSASVPAAVSEVVLQKLCATGRFYCSLRGGARFHLGPEAIPLRFQDGDPWRLGAAVVKRNHSYYLEGFLQKAAPEPGEEDERRPLTGPALFLRTGFVVFRDRIERMDAREFFDWIEILREQKFPPVPETEGDQFVEALTSNPRCPPIDWPPELRWREERPDPRPEVIFSTVPGEIAPEVHAELRFSYDGARVSFKDGGSLVLDRLNRRMIPRNVKLERAAYDRLGALLGTRAGMGMPAGPASFRVKPKEFENSIREVLAWGWGAVAHGKPVRSAGAFDIKVSTGVDWFALDAKIPWADALASSLPELLAAQARGEQLITLGDGSLGVLPTEWLRKMAPLAHLGAASGESIKFAKNQGALLGSWLATEENAVADKDFSKLMTELGRYNGLEPKSPTKSFKGSLRPYQKEGLAWLEYLMDLGQGAILADDMGLGKTVQVLAHLEAVHTGKSAPKKPSIVVLPKSLLFNWQEESAKFTPKLKVIAYAGISRSKLLPELPKADLVLVTYPTLRLDLEELKKLEFHYVIADEAQAIKNNTSLSYKACLQLQGKHRLAMSGTPVENSIDDLFALMDFVSPGLLGKNAREKMSKAAEHGRIDVVALEQLAKAMRPFILRRTKGQVLKDLPEKIEKVLHCELSPVERKRYVELRDYYRDHLRGEIESKGIGKTKLLVLEALLRLRQAACHPGLIDKKSMEIDSTKTDTLLAQLRSVVAEGHKALVFSQFTTFLDIVEHKLTAENIAHVRLDGSISADERKARVKEFQSEGSEKKVFLISLKAGGVGLNLTAADYVFILDPWWNPAAESQAIDRTHRIGQKNTVIAYRLIAKDTVEEKIVELQQAKKDLAAAIFSADTSMLKGLSAQDVEMLLS